VKPARIFIAAGVMQAPAKLFACAACYGANLDAPMAEGMNWAILTLGVVVATVLGAFLTFLIYAIRRSEALEAAKQPSAAPSAAAILKTETLIEERP
jgi:hypothetical protein